MRSGHVRWVCVPSQVRPSAAGLMLGGVSSGGRHPRSLERVIAAIAKRRARVMPRALMLLNHFGNSKERLISVAPRSTVATTTASADCGASAGFLLREEHE
jgi:hypothetical protein